MHGGEGVAQVVLEQIVPSAGRSQVAGLHERAPGGHEGAARERSIVAPTVTVPWAAGRGEQDQGQDHGEVVGSHGYLLNAAGPRCRASLRVAGGHVRRMLTVAR